MKLRGGCFRLNGNVEPEIRNHLTKIVLDGGYRPRNQSPLLNKVYGAISNVLKLKLNIRLKISYFYNSELIME